MNFICLDFLKPGSKNAHLFVSLALVETFGTTNSMKKFKALKEKKN